MDILEQVSHEMDKLMAQYLPEWSWRWDRATRRYGCCHHAQKLITISKALVELNKFEESRDTLLHEIAHGIVGCNHGHDEVWKNACVMIGARPERCYGNHIIQPPKQWVAICPGCLREVYRTRKPRRITSCGQCCSTFNPEFILKYRKREEVKMPNNDELLILIKMENLIGYNQKYLFSEVAIQPEDLRVTRDDFNSFINYIEKVIVAKEKASKKANEWNKAHPERHRESNKRAYLKKKEKQDA